MLVHELDRVLDRDDVAFRIAIAVVDHRSKGSGFTRTGCTHEDDEPALCHGELLEDLRQIQIVARRDVGLDAPQNHAAHVPLLKRGHAKATDAGSDGEVALQMFVELPALISVHHACHDVLGLLGAEGIPGQRGHAPVELGRRRHACSDEEVRSPFLDHEPQQLVEIHFPLLATPEGPRRARRKRYESEIVRHLRFCARLLAGDQAFVEQVR